MAARIVHLSDLHLGNDGDESWEAFREVEHVLQTNHLLAPISVLIVSGDLGNHPNKKHFALIKEQLEALCRKCGLDPARQLVVIPGNHDYRFYGNAIGWLHCPGAFNQVFADWHQPKYLRLADGEEVALFAFDSNISRSGWNFARGEVGAAGLHRFQTQYHALKAQHPGFARAFKIAVTHHHPLPIAAAEAEHVSDAFLGLEDAGTFLRELVRREYGVDLVLHGHKHYPAFGRIKVFTSLFGERELSVLAAGSACKRDGVPRGNSFNVITLDAGRVWAGRWFRETGSFERELTVYDLLSRGAARERAFESFCLDPATGGVRLRREAHLYDLGEYGDCQRRTLYEGLTVAENKPPLGEFRLEKKTRAGQFAGIPITQPPVNTKMEWIADPDASRRHLKGHLTIVPPVRPQVPGEPSPGRDVSFHLEFRVFNSFAMNAAQADRMYGPGQDSEWVSIAVKRPVELLEIEVRFPPKVELPEFRVEVLRDADPAQVPETRPEGEHNVSEEEEGQRQLLVGRDTVLLKVFKPLSKHRYGFSWTLPPARLRSSHALQGRALRLRDRLLALDTRRPESNPLQPVLLKARNAIHQFYGGQWDQPEDYELALWVFDEEERHLRCVAGVFDSAYWKETLLEGEGIAGRAHKQNALICYVRGKVLKGEDYSKPPPAGCQLPEILLVLPLRYPLDTDAPGPVPSPLQTDAPGPVRPPSKTDMPGLIGLLALSITTRACKLLETEMEEKDYEGLTNYLYSECYEKGILPQIVPPEETSTQPTPTL